MDNFLQALLAERRPIARLARQLVKALLLGQLHTVYSELEQAGPWHSMVEDAQPRLRPSCPRLHPLRARLAEQRLKCRVHEAASQDHLDPLLLLQQDAPALRLTPQRLERERVATADAPTRAQAVLRGLRV
eukprot:4314716-Prymnesium_polylepis.1